MIGELSEMSKHLTICGTPDVPWFPANIFDINKIGKKTLCEGDGIEMVDHPGFHDAKYKKRREEITLQALKYNITDKEIQRIEYKPEEVEVWSF